MIQGGIAMNNIVETTSGLDAAAYAETKKTSKVTTGKTIGSPELSDKAKKYYEQLQKKFKGYDFILVSEDKKAEAEANIANYANKDRMVVLINTDKIEKMAEDEDYRKKYEGIISSASSQIKMIKTSLGKNASKVKTFGMKFEEDYASLFAVIDKSLEMQRERIQENAEKKAEEKKKTAKEDLITVTAKTPDELLKKINDIFAEDELNSVRTPQEKLLGQHVNYSL